MIQSKEKILAYLLYAFAIVTSLGSFNPFASYSVDNNGDASSPVALVVQGLFIGALVIFVRGKGSFYKRQSTALIIFTLLFFISGILFCEEQIPQSFWLLMVKLILSVLLYLKLSQFLYQAPELIRRAMFIFIITSIIISTLFMTGLLNQYTVWAGGRAYIFGENPNSYSTRMVCSALFIIYLIVENPFKWNVNRLWLLFGEGPLIFAILASGSRGGFIILFASIALYLWFLPIKNVVNKVIIVLAVSMALIGFVIYVSENNSDFSIFERLTATIETGDNAGRTKLSQAAIEIFNKNLIWGVGAPKFQSDMLYDYGLTHTVHNVYWYVASTTGLIGLIVFGAFLIMLAAIVWKTRRQAPFALVLFAIMLLIGSKTGGALTYITMWFIYAISAAMALRAVKSESK